ncbi:methyl-accepting chemotaxis protein [Alteromonas halophila]|uniref:Methyl-accepting chemotaxis protein n=1 Tax=Alteromonas halophila TaxID=516698 RepID=A0A918MXG4_9ALTE|nr:methyl-accepting chemotaxis protein [Alteromonas halophila]GGW81425.1 hypothetical protein GCM10007391_13250 [Alteromonas halophila]
MFRNLYSTIEKTFFFTLNRKIIGNVLFLFLFQLASFFLLYQYASGAQDSRESLKFWSLVLFIGSVLCVAFTIFYLHYLIVRPVKALLASLNNINHTRGNLSGQLPAFTRDEFRELSDAYNLFVENLAALMLQIHTQAQQGSLANEEVALTVQDTYGNADRQKQLSHDVAAASEDISNSIQDIVGASETVSDRNQHNMTSANQASDQLQHCQRQITRINALLSQFSQTVDGLQENAGNVRNILKMVEEFADQTNLLALNAAIEAARAGESGRGFAVVADEVRTLSAKVADATGQISRFLTDMESLVENTQKESTKVMGESEDMREQLDNTATTFTTMVEDFERNTREIDNILSAVGSLKDKYTHTEHSVSDIRKLSDQVQHQMQEVDRQAKQAQALSGNTSEQLARFIE